MALHKCCVLTYGKHIKSDMSVQTESLCIPQLEQYSVTPAMSRLHVRYLRNYKNRSNLYLESSVTLDEMPNA